MLAFRHDACFSAFTPVAAWMRRCGTQSSRLCRAPPRIPAPGHIERCAKIPVSAAGIRRLRRRAIAAADAAARCRSWRRAFERAFLYAFAATAASAFFAIIFHAAPARYSMLCRHTCCSVIFSPAPPAATLAGTLRIAVFITMSQPPPFRPRTASPPLSCSIAAAAAMPPTPRYLRVSILPAGVSQRPDFALTPLATARRRLSFQPAARD